MKFIRSFLEIFANKYVSEMVYLFTLIIIWVEIILPKTSTNTFSSYFLSIFIILFIISKVIVILTEEEQEKNE